MLDSLPDRPLTDGEAEHLKEQDPRIVPLSILKGEDTDPYVIYTIAFYASESQQVHLLGYSDTEGGWMKFESFREDDWTVDRQEERVSQWIEEQYGDQFEQGVLTDDSGTIDIQ